MWPCNPETPDPDHPDPDHPDRANQDLLKPLALTGSYFVGVHPVVRRKEPGQSCGCLISTNFFRDSAPDDQ
jgi:hypothetical protein